MKQFTFFVGLALLLLVVTGIPAAASPTISAVSPETGPYVGVVSITITGSGFNDESTVWLSACSTGAVIPGSIESVSEDSITATFSFNRETPARYNVMVNSPFTDSFGIYHSQDVFGLSQGFETYQGNNPPPTHATIATTTTPTPAYGSIRVSSVPPGADIYLDNDFKGKTPLTMNAMANGNHAIKILLGGYWDWVQDVTVLGDSPSVSANLIPITTATTVAPAPATTTKPANTTVMKTTVTTTGPAVNATTVQTTALKTVTTTLPITTLSTPTKKPAFVYKTYTPIPTDTPAQESPPGIEIALMALGLAALVVTIRR
jgi:hypothetical protein